MRSKDFNNPKAEKARKGRWRPQQKPPGACNTEGMWEARAGERDKNEAQVLADSESLKALEKLLK